MLSHFESMLSAAMETVQAGVSLVDDLPSAAGTLQLLSPADAALCQVRAAVTHKHAPYLINVHP